MIIIYLISTIFIFVFLIYCYLKRVNTYWKKRSVVGPEPIVFFGNTKESALRRKHVAVYFKDFYNDFPNEKFVGFYRMTSPTLLIRDLDIAKQILIKDFEAFPDRGFQFSKQGLGDNLFHCDPTTWAALRRHVTPLFTSGKLKSFVGLLKDQSGKFVNHIESVSSVSPEQDVVKLFMKYTITSIMACCFGIEVDTIYKNSEVFEHLDVSFFKYNSTNELDLLFPGILKIFNWSLFNKTVVRFCYELVEAVKRQNCGTSETVNNVMDILMELQNHGEAKCLKMRNDKKKVSIKVTDHVLAGQVFVFYAAGYGNNTLTLSNAMYHLSVNPHIQDKLQLEIDGVLEKFSGEVTYECLKEMTYLDQVFYETLRMYPTTNAIQRCAARNYVVPGTDLEIEKDTSIVISPLSIHYDAEFYPNPEQFDPDRFLPEAVKNRHSCAYLPFGAGPRSCLGSRFARLQFKVCVANLLSKFRVEPSRSTKEEHCIDPHRSLLTPLGGVHLKIVPRIA